MGSAAILAIIDSVTKLATTVIDSQTPEQKKIIWDRYIEVTAPLHRWIVKIENLGQSQPQ